MRAVEAHRKFVEWGGCFPESSASERPRHLAFKHIAKDTLIYALEALAQSSDACSPLKSVAGGLMFFAAWADVSTYEIS